MLKYDSEIGGIFNFDSGKICKFAAILENGYKC